jgi:glycosyltransferase involved in cell wall biosynthesis
VRDALAAILADDGRRAAMREAGFRHTARFSEESIAAALVRAYEDALAAL